VHGTIDRLEERQLPRNLTTDKKEDDVKSPKEIQQKWRLKFESPYQELVPRAEALGCEMHFLTLGVRVPPFHLFQYSEDDLKRFRDFLAREEATRKEADKRRGGATATAA
jgi:hypothetical protein